MLWRSSLVVAVLCVGAMCSCVQADLMSGLIVHRDYGVKLCGREFIRAVIFTCGGSRWRRSADGDSDFFQWISPSDVTAQNNQQSDSDLTENLTPPHTSSSQSLSDLLALYAAVVDQQQQQQPPAPPPPPHHHQQQQQLLSDPFLLDTSQPALSFRGLGFRWSGWKFSGCWLEQEEEELFPGRGRDVLQPGLHQE
uniref:Insulin-like domain-containing protein n=1 Tax=Cynoglossus semilaevis TaxID=244447 RepID=A0A3P8WL38_CYNSE